MTYKDEHEFIEYYRTFLQINALLYHPATCPYTEPTPLYEELIHDLLLYIDTMKQDEQERIEKQYDAFETVNHMRDNLIQQLERLEEPYEVQLQAFAQKE